MVQLAEQVSDASESLVVDLGTASRVPVSKLIALRAVEG
jgi:hypothetical protein